jgi:3-dehydroquinate dehydratase-2
MSQILLLNGPNLNLLGTREPGHYGHDSLDKIVARISQSASQAGHELLHLQSNSEAELVERIHQAGRDAVAFIIINPAAFTHTSIAMRDALLGTEIPFIEVHLSNVYRREEFRHHSYFSDIAAGTIVGLGPKGYDLGLDAVIDLLSKQAT